MKVEGPNRTQQTGSSKKKSGVSAGDGEFGRLLAGEGQGAAAGVGTTQSIASIDTLLAAQAVDDPAQRAARKRARVRAGHLLDELEKIRTALLTGGLTVGHVIDIADVVASHRDKIMDPRLTAILDEVDLRAQIELAKLRMALDKAG